MELPLEIWYYITDNLSFHDFYIFGLAFPRLYLSLDNRHYAHKLGYKFDDGNLIIQSHGLHIIIKVLTYTLLDDRWLYWDYILTSPIDSIIYMFKTTGYIFIKVSNNCTIFSDLNRLYYFISTQYTQFVIPRYHGKVILYILERLKFIYETVGYINITTGKNIIIQLIYLLEFS